jgi:regulatory protein
MTAPAPITVLAVSDDEARRAVRVDLSDGTSLTLASTAAEVRDLRPGLALSALDLQRLRSADERKRAARQVFSWLDRRPRTRRDLERRLAERGFSAEAIDPVLDRFEAEGLVDDRAFAERFARERLNTRPSGPYWLTGRLRQEGVDAATVREVVAALFAECEEADVAAEALSRKRFDCVSERGRERAARFLRSRGFSTEAAIEAIRRAKDVPN